MKKILSLSIATCFLLSMGSAHAWKSKKRYAPKINPYAYGYNPYNPYRNPYRQASPYAYPQAYYQRQPFNLSHSFPMMGGQQMPWSQFGGTPFSGGFPMMSGFGGSPFSAMSPTGFGSPFSGMSPMGFGSPLSGMSPMGFGYSPFAGMSPMGFGSSPFGNFKRRGRSNRFMPF